MAPVNCAPLLETPPTQGFWGLFVRLSSQTPLWDADVECWPVSDPPPKNLILCNTYSFPKGPGITWVTLATDEHVSCSQAV